MYNAIGQVVAKGKLESTIDVADLELGVYLIKFNNESKTITKRFIKN
ncbi:T9SS type A sorting domain-containing protein [Winogradskyella sp.]